MKGPCVGGAVTGLLHLKSVLPKALPSHTSYCPSHCISEVDGVFVTLTYLKGVLELMRTESHAPSSQMLWHTVDGSPSMQFEAGKVP